MVHKRLKSVIFDLDGVITGTASVHTRAWKAVFDEFLRLRSEKTGEPFREFTPEDYLKTVDGKPRQDGIRGFLASRGIELPAGDEDATALDSVNGIGNRKNALFRSVLKEKGVDVFQTSVELIKDLRKAGLRVGLATSSKNCDLILESARLKDLFESKVDGLTRAELNLNGKPEPDIFVKAAADVGTLPAESVVVEDATAGVAAGRNGGFGLVLGVARHDNAGDLLANGADIAVADLGDISVDWLRDWFDKEPRPLLPCWEDTSASPEPLFSNERTGGKVLPNPCFRQGARSFLLSAKKRVLFLDYDGTLTPIVSRPQDAVMKQEMRDAVRSLMKKQLVAIVSGRMRSDVEGLVQIPELLFAGSHGFDIKGPGLEMLHPVARKTMPVIQTITENLKRDIGSIEGVVIEEKKFSVAAHYRMVAPEQHAAVREAVNRSMKGRDSVRMMEGKMVYEILPDIEWNKGMAIRWIMAALKLSWNSCSVVYIGDDVTDENAFRAVRTRGAGILVSEENGPSTADFQVRTPDDIQKIFKKILSEA